uniref:Riboflavin transporter n=1 Tax=Podarcis muralis TaxID=64176 RepID=A0A670J1Z5_PODMU
MSLVVHALVCLLGTGSWVAINGMWVELPLIVPSAPEGWFLPSCLTVITQLANVGPLAVTLVHRFLPGRLSEVGVIYAILSLGSLACLLLAFFWGETSVVGSSPRSVALLSLFFLLALVDCTSSVTFLPYMQRLRAPYLSTYFVGEGLSGLLPGLVALGQGVGTLRCVNGSQQGNGTGLRAEYQPARFSATAFFLFLCAMTACCLASFLLLNHLPAARREQAKEKYRVRVQMEVAGGGRATVEERPRLSDPAGSLFGSGTYSWPQVAYIFGLLGWVNALTNGVLPAVQSYSCLPYGNTTYHLSATLAALANPLACLLGMYLPSSEPAFGGLETLCLHPLLIDGAPRGPWPPPADAWLPLQILCWVLFVGLLSYVKLMIGVVLRDEGHSALVWCGAMVQLGSMVGALLMFPLVNVYNLFHSGDPCNTSCPV